MILLEELSPIGKFAKTHGIKGEINITLSSDFDFEDSEYIVVDIDGIFVPFFIEEYRYKSNTSLLVKLEDIDLESKARELYDKTVYVDKNLLQTEEAEEMSAAYYVGFTMQTEGGKIIGQITSIDDTTDNILYEVDDLLIPVAAIEVIDFDPDKKQMTVEIPEGLLDL